MYVLRKKKVTTPNLHWRSN